MRLALLALLATPLAACARRPDASDRPNIVLLIADDMDFEHLGFAGNAQAHTPTLDALAREGVVFTHGFVPMSRCRPAQAALLTGRWPHQTGVTYNVGAPTIDPADALPNHLKAAGYATIGEGKFWEGDPRAMGFSNRAIVNYETFVREGQDELFAFLDEHAGKQPFFVWWAPQLPHVPHDPPERLKALIPAQRIPVPPEFTDDVARAARFREREHRSLAMGAWLDEGVAELLAKLRALGVERDTLLVFLIDNGWANGVVSKGWATDKGLRTPVLFALPGSLAGSTEGASEGGRTFADLVSVVDVYATILDYAGAPIPERCAGVSLRPRVEGRARPAREALYGALYPQSFDPARPDPAAVAYALWARTGRWKYILTLRDTSRVRGAGDDDDRDDVKAVLVPSFVRQRGDEELYDLEADPAERVNLADRPEQRARCAELRAAIVGWWRETGGGPLDLP